MQRIDFIIHSEVDNNDNLDQHWDDDFTLFMSIRNRIELEKTIYNSGGIMITLVRFKNGGYGYYECYELDGEEKKKVFFEGKEIHILKTGKVYFYISNDLSELQTKFEISNSIIQIIQRKEEYIA